MADQELSRRAVCAKLEGHGVPPGSYERVVLKKDGSTRSMLLEDRMLLGDDGGIVGIRSSLQDITERMQVEAYTKMGLEILQRLNETGDLDGSIQHVLAVVKTRTGFDAVGIRLKDGDDFPYFVLDGFSEDFLLTENTLLERTADGGVCLDSTGNVRLECTCGLVLSGKTDPSNPSFTRGGSFWTNDSFSLLDLPLDQDLRLHPRNQCIHHDYASVALVPIRNQNETLGLIQLNDRRKGCFTLETIELMEGIASHIGAALMRKKWEDQLHHNLEEKNVLLREVHHRVRNNLTVISSLLNMQSSTIETPEQAMVAFKNTRDRIAAMALVHGTLYESKDYAHVAMDIYLERLIKQIFVTYGSDENIHVDAQADGIVVGVDAAIPSGLIVTELITNAFKHAFPDGRTGEIRVVLRRMDDDSFELHVSDNGIGLPVGYEGRETLGLSLVRLLAGQLEGTMSISAEDGTRCVIRFPRKAERKAF